MRVYLCLSILAAFGFAENSWGWGENGHRIVGQIAENHLSPAARTKIAQLMGTETLAESSTWGDDVRSDQKFAKYDPWHYVEIPEGKTYATAPKNPKGDVLVGIQATMDVLIGKSTKFTAKEALRYLVHFVGDLHQPLHVGNGHDEGANMCSVKYAGRNTNLHVVWDTHLIEDRKLGYLDFSRFLDRPDLITTTKIKKWTTGKLVDWAQEAIKIRESLYPPANPNPDPMNLHSLLVGEARVAKNRPYCKVNDGEKIPTKDLPKLGFDYEYKYKKVLDEQLSKAGVRLSYILNELFR